MTRFFRWIFWLMLSKLAVCLSESEFFILSGPEDCPAWYNGQCSKEMYCITNETSSALTWNANLDWKKPSYNMDVIEKSYVLPSENYVYSANDTLTCQMSSHNSCSHAWKSQGKWQYVNSLTKPMSPVFDNRFEDFPVEQMSTKFKFIVQLSNTGSLAVSIHGFSDAHFVICNKATVQSFCFFIILGGWGNTKSVIRKCKNGVPEPITSFPTGECKDALVTRNESIFSSTEWKTFVLKWKFQPQISLSIYDTKKELLSYKTTQKNNYFYGHKREGSNTDEYFLFARSKQPMNMKFHKYDFRLTYTTLSKLISPQFMTATPDKNICIEMSYSMCQNCFITVDFADHMGVNKTMGFNIPKPNSPKKELNNLYKLPIWTNVKLQKVIRYINEPITLVFTTFLNNNTNKNDAYWAISNIRRCYDGAVKITKIKAYQDYASDNYFWPNVTCQKLSADGVSRSINSADHKKSSVRAETKRLCPAGKIGSYCSVSCSNLFQKYKDCNNILSCDIHGCSCAEGFMMPTCKNYCPDSTYGHECKQQCGNCMHSSCHYATGMCVHGCQNTKNIYYLKPYCQTKIESPSAPTVELISSVFTRIYLNMKNEYRSTPMNIIFEIWTNSEPTPVIKKVIPIQQNTFTIDMYAEHLKPGIHYGAIAILHLINDNQTLRGKWNNFTTPCTEIKFNVRSEETNITVNSFIDKHENDLCPTSWYRVTLLRGSKKLFDNSTDFPITISNLDVFTPYNVIIRSEKLTIVNKTIYTLEGVPSVITNLHVVSTDADKAILTWQPPKKANGKIVNYTIEIEPSVFLGCADLKRPTYTSINVNIGKQLQIRKIVKNTEQKEFNFTFNGLKPYTNYTVKMYASTSRYQGEIKVMNFSTLAIEKPTEMVSNLHLTNETSEKIAAILKWDPPSDCTTITGPIRAFKVYLKQINGVASVIETDKYSYPLYKFDYFGTETYEAKVYPLREYNSPENETVYTRLEFKLPARAPPPVRSVYITEVDIDNKTISLKWDKPLPPMHGELDYYSIVFCNNNGENCDKSNYFIAHIDDSCLTFDSQDTLCAVVPFPDSQYDMIQISAHNKNVTERSKPVSIPVRRIEFAPTEPLDLSLNLSSKAKTSVNVSWKHPLYSGGKLEKFIIEARIIESNLTIKKWAEKIFSFEIVEKRYQLNYEMEIELLPSTTFAISVRAKTVGGLFGRSIVNNITLPNYVHFSTEDLQPKPTSNLMILIRIPKIINNIWDTTMLVIVQGSKYCDTGTSNNDDVHFYVNTQNSSYYKTAWIAAKLTEPEKFANKQFIIGNSEIIDGSKNYALCSKESYIINLVLIQNKYNAIGSNVLKLIRTNVISLDEMPKNYAMWLTLPFFIILIGIIIIFIVYRKKFRNRFLKDKPINQQEDILLANDFNKKSDKTIKVVITVNRTQDIPNNNLFIVEKTNNFLMPIKVDDFENYLESVYKSNALNALKNEFSLISDGPNKPCSYGSLPELKQKNRYVNLFPYDDTRVILEKLPDEPYSDYIQASYITGYGGKEKAYIATQGPLPNTVTDFWRMIWQEKVRIICMMANLVENNKVQCEMYWPSGVGEELLYGRISVLFSAEETHSDYTYRKFLVSCENQETRTIEHLHYTSWPDHGVPANPRSMVAFLKKIQKHAPIPRKSDEPPIVVHCSAGIGRTGTLIVLDMSLCRAFSENVIDVCANVLAVRKDRLNMVGNANQYLFVHLVLVEYLNLKDTCFPCDKTLSARIVEAKENASSHYRRILDTSWWNEVLGSPPLPEKSLSYKNRAKHRYPELAGALNRLFLKRLVIMDEDSDYIAATWVKNIFKHCQYITTQLPMPSTAVDFWRMLLEQNVEYVLVLQLPDLQNSTYCELIPENQEFGNMKYLKVSRQESPKINSQFYAQEKVLITLRHSDGSEQPSEEQMVNLIMYKNWPESSLPPPHELVKLWKIFEEFPKEKSRPIVTVCCNGITASGIWLTLSFLLKRMAIDQECDVPQAVRVIQRCRRDFLNKPEYLKYLYDVALAWSAEEDI